MRLLLPLLASLFLIACKPVPPGPLPEPVAAEAPAPRDPNDPCPEMDVRQNNRLAEEAAESAKVEAQPMANRALGIDFTQFGPFCRDGGHPLCDGAAGRQLTKAEVERVDAALRAKFRYASDYAYYGGDRWIGDTNCGDCEDYALTLSKALTMAGASGDSLALMLWQPEPGYGHATLLVLTSDAGLLEAGVGPGETPAPYNAAYGLRIATMTMNGKHQISLLPGWDFKRFGRSMWFDPIVEKTPHEASSR